MYGKKVFGLGQYSVTMILTILDAIPRKWEAVHGKIQAAQNLIDSGMIAKSTVFIFEKSALPPTFGRVADRGDLNGLFNLSGRFQAYEFNGASRNGDKPLSMILRFISKQIVGGYLSGQLHFYSKINDHDLNAYRERCSIRMGEWLYPEGAPAKKKKVAPSAVVMEWETSRGGNIERLQPIIEACQSLSLKEIVL